MDYTRTRRQLRGSIKVHLSLVVVHDLTTSKELQQERSLGMTICMNSTHPLTTRWFSLREVLHGRLDAWMTGLYLVNHTKNSPKVPHNQTTTHCS